MPPAALLLDCDGVLVDSEAIARDVLLTLAGEVGDVPGAAELGERLTGRSLTEVVALLERELGVPLPADFPERYRRLSAERFAADLRPIAGVRELLGGLPVPAAVVSNGPPEKIRANLATTGLASFFPAGRRFSAYEIGHWKPDPALFLYAAAALGVAPAGCLVVEDSVPGVEAALAGGFRVLGFTDGRAPKRAALATTGVPLAATMAEVASAIAIGGAPHP